LSQRTKPPVSEPLLGGTHTNKRGDLSEVQAPVKKKSRGKSHRPENLERDNQQKEEEKDAKARKKEGRTPQN